MSHQLPTVVPLGDLARSAEAGLISALIATAGGHLGWRKLRDAPPTDTSGIFKTRRSARFYRETAPVNVSRISG